MRVLIVDDEVELTELLKLSLGKEGWVVDTANTLDDAKAHMDAYGYSVVVVDRTVNGKDISRTLIDYAKLKNPTSAVLILSALGTIDEKVEGLEWGADDYMEKPFDTKELKARLNALQRRFSAKAVELEEFSIDQDSKTIMHQNQQVVLSKNEHALFFLLLQHAPQILSREDILDALYANPEKITPNSVDELVARVRKKLSPTIIKTVKTRGFMVEI